MAKGPGESPVPDAQSGRLMMRLDNIPGSAVPYTGARPELVHASRRPDAAPRVKPAPELLGSASKPSSDGSGPAESSQSAAQSADYEKLAEAIDGVNDKLSRVNRRLDLYLVDGTNQVAAKIVDTISNEVVKFIPPEEVLELRSRIEEMRGILLNEGA